MVKPVGMAGWALAPRGAGIGLCVIMHSLFHRLSITISTCKTGWNFQADLRSPYEANSLLPEYKSLKDQALYLNSIF